MPSFLQLKQIAGRHRYHENTIEHAIHEKESSHLTDLKSKNIMFSLEKLSLVSLHRLPLGSASVDCAVCNGALGAQEITGDLFVTCDLSQATSWFWKTRLKTLRCVLFCLCSLLVGWLGSVDGGDVKGVSQFVCGLTFHQVVEVAVVGSLVSDHIPVFRDGHGLQVEKLEQSHTEAIKLNGAKLGRWKSQNWKQKPTDTWQHVKKL